MRTFIGYAILALSCLAIGCNFHWITVPTGAMRPTIKVDANVITDQSAYSAGKAIDRFDIVIHRAPISESMRKVGLNENTRFIFRVIGLGGEKVEIKKGRVFIDDKLLEEPFEKNESIDDFGPVFIPENEFFLLGDNRPGSDDSRSWKPATIKRESIFGKVVKIF